MIKKVLNIKQEVIYQDEDNDRVYRRIVGAFAWPVLPKPGYLVVLAEELLTTIIPGVKPKLWVVGEKEATDEREIYRACLELRRDCAADKWLTDISPSRRQEKDAFLMVKKEFPQVQPVSMQAAPYSDIPPTVATYSKLIIGLTKPEDKILNFPEGSSLPGYLLALTPQESERPAVNFPSVCALGYAVAEMVLHQPAPTGRSEKPNVIGAYKPTRR